MSSSTVASPLISLFRRRRPSSSVFSRSSFVSHPLICYKPVVSARRATSSSSSDPIMSHTQPLRAAAAAPGDGRPNNLFVFDTEEQIADALAEHTANLSQKFADERGAFSVVVSGGSLIRSLRKLAEAPYADSVEWSKWHVFWVDERVVPKDHQESNYKLAYDGLLSKVPIPPGHVYAINDSLSVEGAAEDYESCLKHLVNSGIVKVSEETGFPIFDLMLLGMGPDGHIASLFPGHPLLMQNQRWVTFIKDSPKPPPERITFTLPVINSSANIIMAVTGAGKASAFHQAVACGTDSSDVLPVQMIHPQNGELIWFADKDASSKL